MCETPTTGTPKSCVHSTAPSPGSTASMGPSHRMLGSSCLPGKMVAEMWSGSPCLGLWSILGWEAALRVGCQQGPSGVWRSGEITWRLIRTWEVHGSLDQAQWDSCVRCRGKLRSSKGNSSVRVSPCHLGRGEVSRGLAVGQSGWSGHVWVAWESCRA